MGWCCVACFLWLLSFHAKESNKQIRPKILIKKPNIIITGEDELAHMCNIEFSENEYILLAEK